MTEERISVFDIFKIGVGPSSSHTLGPWRATQRFWQELLQKQLIDEVTRIQFHLYGSLAKTGKGHGTHIALMLGIAGYDPVEIDPQAIAGIVDQINLTKRLTLPDKKEIEFHPTEDIIWHPGVTLEYHSNGLCLEAFNGDQQLHSSTFYSIGGGFIKKEGENLETDTSLTSPFPVNNAEDLLHHCHQNNKSIWEIVYENEKAWRSEAEIESGVLNIWEVMKNCIFRGCTTQGILPGGLGVVRRAADIGRKLLNGKEFKEYAAWQQAVEDSGKNFSTVLDWVTCFALAVNEENASFGRVVTAPTNGAAGVIPAVLQFSVFFRKASSNDIIRFLLTASVIGSIFKKGATISAAMGGCQAEIGVSSAMAAAALTEISGGSPEKCLMAAEIAMEHHLGLTCDPVAGLVQIPCIERNTMGAIKAITASQLALNSNPANARVTLDEVVQTMWDTAKDMHTRYKETAEGGLATHIPISLSEC